MRWLQPPREIDTLSAELSIVDRFSRVRWNVVARLKPVREGESDAAELWMDTVVTRRTSSR